MRCIFFPVPTTMATEAFPSFLCLDWSQPEERVLDVMRALGKNVAVATTIQCACKRDYVNCLQHIHRHGERGDVAAAWDANNGTRVSLTAARHGAVRCLRYAMDTGCLCDASVCAAAAQSGSEECLRFLLDRGCPADASVCSAACKGSWRGSGLACLRLARARGCLWNSEASGWATHHADMPCLEYLTEHGCPFDVDGFLMGVEAMLDGPPSRWDTHMSCLKYLVDRGCPWSRRELLKLSDAQSVAAELPVRCPWDAAAADDANDDEICQHPSESSTDVAEDAF